MEGGENTKGRLREEIDTYLKEIYYNPQHEASFSNPQSLYEYVKSHGRFKLSRDQIKSWLRWQDVYTTHVSKQKGKVHSPVIVPYIRYQYDIDSGWMTSLSLKSKKNFILAVDVFSRRVAARGVVNLKAKTVSEALHEILDEMGTPEKIRTDQGGEYVNKESEKLFKSKGIEHFIAYPPNKANYAERAIRTIKNLLYKQMESKGKNNWTEEMLQDTIEGYNKRKHRSIGMAPIKVTENNESQLWSKQQSKLLASMPIPTKFKYELNDPVRVIVFKTGFNKDYERKFSQAIYFISERFAPFNIQRYRLKNHLNEPISGSYLSSELQKVNIDQESVYKIEKVVSKRTRNGQEEVRVRWEGYGPRFDSWIPANELEKLSDSDKTDQSSSNQARREIEE